MLAYLLHDYSRGELHNYMYDVIVVPNRARDFLLHAHTLSSSILHTVFKPNYILCLCIVTPSI